MTRPTDTTETTERFAIFRSDASAFTEAQAVKGIIFKDRNLAEIALYDLKLELPALERKYLSVRKILHPIDV